MSHNPRIVIIGLIYAFIRILLSSGWTVLLPDALLFSDWAMWQMSDLDLVLSMRLMSSDWTLILETCFPVAGHKITVRCFYKKCSLFDKPDGLCCKVHSRQEVGRKRIPRKHNIVQSLDTRA